MRPREERIQIQNRLLEIRPRALERIRHIDGVVDVGVGFKVKDGQLTEDIVLRVYVSKKKTLYELNPADVIPVEFEGVPTDVIEIRPTVPASKKARPVKGGLKIMNDKNKNYGTLGCMATRTSNNKAVLLSNDHVLYADGAADGSKIGQPSGDSCKFVGTNVLGIRDGTVDGAIAEITVDSNATIDQIGNVTGTATAVVGDTVRKMGARTGLTTGVVTSITYATKDTDKGIYWTGQVEVQTNQGKDKFADHGDSGSVIVDANNNVIALLWGISVDSPYNGCGSPIDKVMSELGITINTSSTVADPQDSRLSFSLDDPIPQQYVNILSATPTGTAIVGVATRLSAQQGTPNNPILGQHWREVEDLIHNNRAVKVVWYDNQGPNFFDAIQTALQDPNAPIPTTVNGVGFSDMVNNVADALVKNGSSQLIADITTYRNDVTALLPLVSTGGGMAYQVAHDKLNCASLKGLWGLMWKPSGAFYLPNVLQNGVNLPGFQLPSLAQVNAGDLPATTLFNEPVLGYITFQTSNCTVTGLPTITQSGFACDDSVPGQTSVTVNLGFSQITYSGNFTVSAGGAVGCALASAATLLGGGSSLTALAAGIAVADDSSVPDQLALARFYRDGPLQSNADGSANLNGRLMVGTYYLHQDTVNEIISDPTNQNVQVALTASSARQMSQQVTAAAQSYKDNPGQQHPLPALSKPGFDVNNAIAVVCMQKINNHQDPGGRYSALLTDQTRFYQSVVWAQRNRPQDVASVGGVLGIVQTVDPATTTGNGTARIHLPTAAQRIRMAYGEPHESVVPPDAMAVTDPVSNELIAYVTLDGPPDVRRQASLRTPRLGAMADLHGSFSDTLSDIGIEATLSLAVDAQNQFQIGVTRMNVSIGGLSIKLATTDHGWAPGLFDKVENAIANASFIRDAFVLLLQEALSQQAVRDQIGQALTGAINHL